MATWGLAKDEFTDNGNWPHQLYVREARRMVGDYVMTEHDCRRHARHAASRSAWARTTWTRTTARATSRRTGIVQNEGDVQVSPGGPYPISYRSIVPKAGECPNLLVPVCLSQLAHRLRLDPHGAGVHGPRPERRDRRGAGDRRQASPCRRSTTRSCASGCWPTSRCWSTPRPPTPGGIDPKKLPGIVVDDDAGRADGLRGGRAARVGAVRRRRLPARRRRRPRQADGPVHARPAGGRASTRCGCRTRRTPTARRTCR